MYTEIIVLYLYRDINIYTVINYFKGRFIRRFRLHLYCKRFSWAILKGIFNGHNILKIKVFMLLIRKRIRKNNYLYQNNSLSFKLFFKIILVSIIFSYLSIKILICRKTVCLFGHIKPADFNFTTPAIMYILMKYKKF